MTLAELVDELTSRGVLPLAPQKKTALRKLAAALGSTLETCEVGEACRTETSWLTVLDTYFDALTTPEYPISTNTRRNTRTDLRTVFKLAAAHRLLEEPLPPTMLQPMTRTAFDREQRRTRPYKATYKDNPAANRYGLRQADWPPAIQEGWRAYRAACGRRIRDTTLAGYVTCLQTYFGFLLNVCHDEPTWEDLFDPVKLDAFVTWHATRVGQDDTSAHGWHVVIGAAAIARVVKHDKADEVLAFSRTVERAPTLHDKREHHWVSLTRLDEIAEACLSAGRRPYVSHGKVKSPGVRGATRFQLGLMIKWLTRIPLRSRNLREMRLGKNLKQDREGHWRLEFRGRELKAGKHDRRMNAFLVDVTQQCPPAHDNLVQVLEEFLTVYRPRIPGATPDGLLFLTQLGTPYDASTLRKEIGTIVARHEKGIRFHPHLIRSVWASEYLEEHPGDFATVAEMLNNTLPVVIKSYFDTVPKAEQAKASAWTSAKFGRGGGGR